MVNLYPNIYNYMLLTSVGNSDKYIPQNSEYKTPAPSMADIVVVEAPKQIRHSITREFKLSVVEWYYNNNKNILPTSTGLMLTDSK